MPLLRVPNISRKTENTRSTDDSLTGACKRIIAISANGAQGQRRSLARPHRQPTDVHVAPEHRPRKAHGYASLIQVPDPQSVEDAIVGAEKIREMAQQRVNKVAHIRLTGQRVRRLATFSRRRKVLVPSQPVQGEQIGQDQLSKI
jgi:hypothetical protein